jgi:hypothetical protein
MTQRELWKRIREQLAREGRLPPVARAKKLKPRRADRGRA